MSKREKKVGEGKGGEEEGASPCITVPLAITGPAGGTELPLKLFYSPEYWLSCMLAFVCQVVPGQPH